MNRNGSALRELIRKTAASSDSRDDGAGLATAWDAASKADVLRLLDQDAAMTRRENARFHRVQDAVASRVAGVPIDTSNVNEDGMEVKVDSPDTTTTTNYNYPPQKTSPLVAGLLGAMAALLLAILAFLMHAQPSAPASNPPPVNPPSPASGGWDVDISVR